MNRNKKIIVGVIIVLLIIVIGIIVAYKLIENSVTNREDFKFNVENISSNPVDTEKTENEINNKVTTISIQETGLSSVTPAKEYTLNQEEIYTIFSIIDNLTFSNETCDGLPTYFISYNSQEKEGFMTYGIEIFDSAYHITLDGKGEAILSTEQKEKLNEIIEKLHN